MGVGPRQLSDTAGCDKTRALSPFPSPFRNEGKRDKLGPWEIVKVGVS